MFTIQYLDHEEGSCALWREVKNSRYDTREQARERLKYLRATDDEWCLYSYRIVEVGSDLYYSQPTDKLEY
jgi:hypothetical protein